MSGPDVGARVNAGVLEDFEALTAADPGEMLRQVASSAAQIREAQLMTAEAGIARLAGESRPRAVVVVGMGGSAISGDVLAAVAGPGCPVPIMTVRGYQLPGWVGAADLVIAVSCSGGTEETLAVAAEAIRRGCRLLCVGAADSPLAALAAQVKAVFVPVRSVGQPRATLWGLTVPLILAARELGLTEAPDEVFEATASRLEDISNRCRPSSESFLNPGKQLALDLAGAVPMVWGTSALAGVAAYRFACQCNENAKYPAVWGELPEADHNQVVAFDGFFGRLAGGSQDGGDFFRDRSEEPDSRLHLLVLRDTREHSQVIKRREASVELARMRGVPVTEITAEGDHPLERIATLIALVDYATVYLAIALGVDPTPVSAIQELKARIA
ncbi:SIS domain-containing protein [Actinomadura sp. HBU206391]|uniref:SIS domain-containing protein n=1 Tax=Actinomadura sp. HBU206391 TaxID=2731692 RepID=UPI001650A48F|nr:SIS domain-containing protein [Actinomadura sp. HBU206391]MBC6456755.1 mannose-6-phosphate isomerase [Actinomadura sp. HBU206391]